MGIPAPAGVAISTIAAGDTANAVISGTISAVGPGAPFAFLGPFNAVLYASINTSLTTTANSSSASVTTGTGLAVGNAIKGANIPYGTTWLTFSGTSGTLAFPPGFTNANVVTGVDSKAIFTGAAINYSGTIQLERSFDGGATWIVCGVGGTGTLAQWTTGTPVSVVVGEPEKMVLYRFNCIAYTSGTVNYRISATGVAALSVTSPSTT